jgi:hypothetical protein
MVRINFPLIFYRRQLLLYSVAYVQLLVVSLISMKSYYDIVHYAPLPDFSMAAPNVGVY